MDIFGFLQYMFIRKSNDRIIEILNITLNSDQTRLVDDNSSIIIIFIHKNLKNNEKITNIKML